MLKSLSMNYRIMECKIKYGNPISDKLGANFEREVLANTQAIEYERNNP